MTHITIGGLDWLRDSIWATSAEIYLSGVYYGALDSNVVFALSIFLSADNSKSRRCLDFTLKVVVVKYVVENKIGVFLHYLGHFCTRIHEF
jgi:hypothetical protein